MVKKIIKGIKNPFLIVLYLLQRPSMFRILSDDVYLKIIYKIRMGKKLDLINPRGLNEKLQWLKLYDRQPEYTQMVDKYEVRKYIAKMIGKEYLIPILGVYNNFDEIDFANLPNQFILKPNHTSGDIFICKDKTKIDFLKLRKEIDAWLKREYYTLHREWPYKNVRPRILCEKLLEAEIKDYKFYCFNGEPKFLYVSQGLVTDHSLRVDFFDLEWNLMPFRRTDYPSFEHIPLKPINFGEMINICKLLSREKIFIRVDLFEVDEKIYFSELTFYPCSGYMPLWPTKYDQILGDQLNLFINK